MRILPRSLQMRMLLLSAVATLAALALAGVVIASVLERFVMQGLDRRLDGEIALLASAVDADGHIDRARLAQRLGAFEQDRGWRWRIAGPGGTIGSSDFPALDGPKPPAAGPPPPDRGPHPPPPPPPGDPHPGPQPLDGHEDGIAVHARALTIATRGGPVTLVAAAPRDVVRQPIRAAVAPLLVALGALAALLTTAVLVQLRVGLRPLRRLRDAVAAIRTGERTRVDEDQPDELRPLAVELNALAADNEAALAGARASSANLAHALKTPVATLAIDVRNEPRLAAQVARIEATIRHHLARARVQVVDRRAATPLGPALEGIATAVRRLHAMRGIAITVADADGLTVALDPHDLDELLGNLVDNAARHARQQVTVRARRDGRIVSVAIADDGPGIPAEARTHAFAPGTRLDERGEGHGFGLAIAGELAALYGGAIRLDDAPGGGLLATVSLPVSGGPA